MASEKYFFYETGPTVAGSYWLMKSEPGAFSIDDLACSKDRTTPWDGVRNYEARNFMRDRMKTGDGVLFYHSNVKLPAIVGTARVSSVPYPDPTQFDPADLHYDPRSDRSHPRWILVNVTFTRKFLRPVTRDELRADPLLSGMMILRRNRLSITPVTEAEWLHVHDLAGATP